MIIYLKSNVCESLFYSKFNRVAAQLFNWAPYLAGFFKDGAYCRGFSFWSSSWIHLRVQVDSPVYQHTMEGEILWYQEHVCLIKNKVQQQLRFIYHD